MILETEHIWLFLLILPVVSFLYASVGHGGASGYLALMALFSFAPEVMKPTALLLNLFVAGIAFYYYYKEGYFNLKLFSTFAIASIPFAFVGGMNYQRMSGAADIAFKAIKASLIIIAILPIMAFYPFLLRYFVKGRLQGSVKE